MGYIRLARGTLAAALSAALVTAALVGTPGTAIAAGPACVEAPQPTGTPVKILIAGDSITNMSSGDYTWRYFLWKFLKSKGVNVDFVGRYDGTLDNVTYSQIDSHAYADCDFDWDHEARGGAKLAQYNGPAKTNFGQEFPYYPLADNWIAGAVANYSPDVVIELAGGNDLLHYEEDHGNVPTGSVPIDTMATNVVAQAEQFVDNVQDVSPSTDVIVATAPAAAGSNPRYTAFNTKLSQQYAGWSDGESTVKLLTLPSWSGHSWDGWHPDGQGDAFIAAAAAAVLHSLDPNFPVGEPAPNNVQVGPRLTAELSAEPGADGQALLTWTTPPGSNRTLVYKQDLDAGTAPVLAADLTRPTNSADPNAIPRSFTATGLYPTHQYRFFLRSAKGASIATDLSSNPHDVDISGTPPPASVGTPGATSQAHSVRVTWSSTANATGYKVYWRRHGTSAWSATPVLSGSTFAHVVPGLPPGVAYDFAVGATRSGAPESAKSGLRTLAARPYTLVSPRTPKLRVVAGHKVKVTWTARSGSSRYLVQVRLGAKLVKSVFVTKAMYTSAALKKGKTYKIRVRPYDGVYAGGFSPAGTIKVK